MRILVVFLFFNLWLNPLVSQEDFRFEDDVYLDYIKSVKLHHAGLPTSLPMIDLGSSGRLVLTFDDLEGGDKDYTYEIIHCDRNWNRSDLDEYDFINGFNNEEIDNVSYSRGTDINYTNYSLTLPNDDIEWIVSGNYLLVVYEDEYDKVPALTRRFMVVEPLVKVLGQVIDSRNVGAAKTHHALDISINNKDFRISNAMSEIEVFMLQNHRWDTALKGIKPGFVRGDNIELGIASRNEFPAGKEFRIVDLRSAEYRGEGVHSLETRNGIKHALVHLDQNRYWKNYHTYDDINGQYVLDNADRGGAMHSEYMNVYFNIELERPLLDGDIYIVGAFNDWQLKEENRLVYDSFRNLYSTDFLLRQGFYDYIYAVKTDDGVDYSVLEGDWFETRNEYTILVYYSEFGSRFDRLIGVGNLASNRY
jgi:hypothetical protein